MAYNTTASLDKLTCTNYVGFGKCQDTFGQFSWYKSDFNDLDVKLTVFKKDENKEFRLVPNVAMGEADFNQFMRVRNKLVKAAKSFAREEILTPALIPTMSKDMDEELKLAHKVVDVVDQTNKKICVTLLRYNVIEAECSYVQVQLFVRRKEDEKFQQVVYVNYKLEEFFYILEIMNSVYDKNITNQPIVMFHKNQFHLFTLYCYFFDSIQDELEHWR